MDSEMLKRAARAAKAEWAGFIDCPGEMYDSEAARISRAALLAALDPASEALVERMAKAHWNANPTAARMTMTYDEGTGAFPRVASYVLWDDEDMSESDRETWRFKTKAALMAAQGEHGGSDAHG